MLRAWSPLAAQPAARTRCVSAISSVWRTERGRSKLWKFGSVGKTTKIRKLDMATGIRYQGAAEEEIEMDSGARKGPC